MEARSKPQAALLPFAAALIAMASLQAGATVAKSLFPQLGPPGVAALRVWVGASLLLVFVRPWRLWPARAPLAPLAATGAIMATAMLLFFMAIERLPLGVAVSLQFLGPLAVAVFNSHRPRDLIWAGLAGTGVWLLVGWQGRSFAIDPVGVLCALGAAAGWAGYILCGRAAGAAFGRAAAPLALSLAAIALAPAGVGVLGSLTWTMIPTVLVVAILSTALPFTLEFYALPRLPPRTFAVMTSLEPAFAVLFGLTLLGEVLLPRQLAGVVLVITAAAGAAWTSRTRPE